MGRFQRRIAGADSEAQRSDHQEKDMATGNKPNAYDGDGQPKYAFNMSNNCAKAFEQLSGICHGILADGEVNLVEAKYFHDWLRRHNLLDSGWALDSVIKRVARIFDDGVITDEERQELKAIMEAIVGADGTVTAQPKSTTLPLDDPPPPLLAFPQRYFCVTGKFAYGTRSTVFAAIEARDGIPTDAFPTKSTNYLVIGTFASRDWINTNYGLKIQRAVDLRANKTGIQIISEDHWRNFLQ